MTFNLSPNGLSDSTFILDRHTSGGANLYYDDIYVGAIINGLYENDVLVSGKVELVPGVQSVLSSFNGR